MPADSSILKRRAGVLGAEMAYAEMGEGRPIVFVHGNPTSSFLWRKVIPEVAHLGRCIAPDLIGMGDSDKVGEGPDAYRLVEHRRYLEGLLEALGVADDVVLVAHDWGGPLAFDWGSRHPDAVSGVAFMETMVAPIESWEEWPEASRRLFQAMRSEAGEEIILEKNVFVERILPTSVLDPLPDQVMEEYRRPYQEPGESRRPTLTWPRQLPVGGEPAEVVAIVEEAASWLASAEVPKLYIDAEPGFLSAITRTAVAGWPNLTRRTVRGVHFIQEDSGPEIGRMLAEWIEGL